MTFTDGLKDICTIKTTSIIKSDLGNEEEIETIIYADIFCRLGKGKSRFINTDITSSKKFVITYKLYTLLENSLAKKGDYVYIGEEKYIIIHGQMAKGGNDNHFVYEIEKYE